MATFETTLTAPFGAVTIFRMITALDNMRLALVEMNTARLTRKALYQLDDRGLDDIGLTRADIAKM